MKQLDKIEYNFAELTGYHTDHKQPREEYFYNTKLTVEELDCISNYQLLCPVCHCFKTSQEMLLKQFLVRTWEAQFREYFETDNGKLFAQMRHFRGTIYGKLPDWDKIKGDCKA